MTVIRNPNTGLKTYGYREPIATGDPNFNPANHIAYDVELNRALETGNPFARNPESSIGLVFAFFQGKYRKTDNTVGVISAGTVTLVASSTNYVQLDYVSNALIVNQTGFDANKSPLYKLVTGSSAITAVYDQRLILAPLSAVPDKIALADLAAIPKPASVLWVSGFEFSSQVGFPNGGYGPSDPSRQWNWVVTGALGSSTLTYVSGDSFSDIGTLPFAVDIHQNDGEWKVYSVLTSSAGTITLNRPLEGAVTAGAMSNHHFQGNHLTENGYYAEADFVYTSPRNYATRGNYLERFLPTDTVGKFVVMGGGNPYAITYNLATNTMRTDKRVFAAANRILNMGTTATGQGITWAGLNLSQRKGILEINIGIRVGSSGLLTVTFDNQATFTQVIGIDLKTIRIPFNNCKTANITITNNDNTTTDFAIGRIFAWSDEAPAGARLFNPFAKILLFRDSWGVFPINDSSSGQSGLGEAFRRRLEYRMGLDIGLPVSVANYSSGGKTSRWARWWFKNLVLDHKPDYAIIGFGTNDANGVSTTEALPDGSSLAQGPVSAAEYQENISWMIAQCELHGIVPIIIMPSSSAAPGQTQGKGAYAEVLGTGGNLATVINVYANLYADTLFTDALQGGGGLGAGNPMTITTAQPNSSVRIGLNVKSSATTTGGELFNVSNNASRVFGVDFDGLLSMPIFSIGFVSGQIQLRNVTGGGGAGAGKLAIVSNPASGKGALIYSDASNWRYVSDNSIAL